MPSWFAFDRLDVAIASREPLSRFPTEAVRPRSQVGPRLARSSEFSVQVLHVSTRGMSPAVPDRQRKARAIQSSVGTRDGSEHAPIADALARGVPSGAAPGLVEDETDDSVDVPRSRRSEQGWKQP